MILTFHLAVCVQAPGHHSTYSGHFRQNINAPVPSGAVLLTSLPAEAASPNLIQESDHQLCQGQLYTK